MRVVLLPKSRLANGYVAFRRYCATRGLLFSHVGWIFFKPRYAKLHFIERDDLEQDPGSLTGGGSRFVCKSTDRGSRFA